MRRCKDLYKYGGEVIYNITRPDDPSQEIRDLLVFVGYRPLISHGFKYGPPQKKFNFCWSFTCPLDPLKKDRYPRIHIYIQKILIRYDQDGKMCGTISFNIHVDEVPHVMAPKNRYRKKLRWHVNSLIELFESPVCEEFLARIN